MLLRIAVCDSTRIVLSMQSTHVCWVPQGYGSTEHHHTRSDIYEDEGSRELWENPTNTA